MKRHRGLVSITEWKFDSHSRSSYLIAWFRWWVPPKRRAQTCYEIAVLCGRLGLHVDAVEARTLRKRDPAL